METPFEPGSRLGGFVVRRLVGAGGMGLVYKVHDLELDMPFAAKVLHPNLKRERDFVRRFKTEARIARRLTHMNVTHVFAFKKWRGHLFYTMEYVDGRALDEVLAAEGRLEIDRSIDIIRRVAAGLDYIHRRRYVHRDVKPGNILLRADGHLKIADFGLAQHFGRIKRTRSGHVMGTAKYMAPELIEGTKVYPETDIYALGAMAWELFAGKPIFNADDANVLMDMHMYTKPKALVEVNPDVDHNLSDFVAKMLEKSRRNRIPSAQMVQSCCELYFSKGFFPELPRSLRTY